MNIYCHFESLVCIILRCLHHLNFQSSQILKNLTDSTGAISMSESHIIYLDGVCVWMKYISSFFFRMNIIPLIITHLLYTIHIHSRCLQFVIISLLYIIRLVLSANPIIMIPSSSNSLYSEAIYRMNRIRNNDDPYNTPIWSFRRAALILSNRRCIVCISR